jgi:hypothetical protein
MVNGLGSLAGVRLGMKCLNIIVTVYRLGLQPHNSTDCEPQSICCHLDRRHTGSFPNQSHFRNFRIMSQADNPGSRLPVTASLFCWGLIFSLFIDSLFFVGHCCECISCCWLSFRAGESCTDNYPQRQPCTSQPRRRSALVKFATPNPNRSDIYQSHD